MTGGQRDGRAPDTVGGAENVIDVLIDHQWTRDPTENPERVRLIVEDLNGKGGGPLSLGLGISTFSGWGMIC